LQEEINKIDGREVLERKMTVHGGMEKTRQSKFYMYYTPATSSKL
jgi:hypothetical protein